MPRNPLFADQSRSQVCFTLLEVLLIARLQFNKVFLIQQHTCDIEEAGASSRNDHLERDRSMGDIPELNFQRFPLWMSGLFAPDRRRCCLVLLLFVPACVAQVSSTPGAAESAAQNQLAVNWLYGAYIPKEAPLDATHMAMNGIKLFIRQSFTTPGIYIKTGFFTLHDQVRNTPPEWGDGFEGFAKRLGTRQTQFLLQNSFTSLGNAMVGMGASVRPMQV